LRFATAFCFNRGAYAPRSCVAARTFAGEKRFLRCTNARPQESGGREPAVVRSYDRCAVRSECCSATSKHTPRIGGRQPAVGGGNALATLIPLTSGDTRHVRRQERRASARRGYRYRTCSGASTKLLQTADGACADRRCIRVQAYHGGLTPPALVLHSERLPAKNDFCDARTHIHKSGGREPAVGVGKMFTQTKARLFGRPPRVRVPIAGAFASRLTTGG